MSWNFWEKIFTLSLVFFVLLCCTWMQGREVKVEHFIGDPYKIQDMKNIVITILWEHVIIYRISHKPTKFQTNQFPLLSRVIFRIYKIVLQFYIVPDLEMRTSCLFPGVLVRQIDLRSHNFRFQPRQAVLFKSLDNKRHCVFNSSDSATVTVRGSNFENPFQHCIFPP